MWIVLLASVRMARRRSARWHWRSASLSEGTVIVEDLGDRLRDDRITLIVMDTQERLTSAYATLAVRSAQTSAAGYQPRAVECARQDDVASSPDALRGSHETLHRSSALHSR